MLNVYILSFKLSPLGYISQMYLSLIGCKVTNYNRYGP